MEFFDRMRDESDAGSPHSRPYITCKELGELLDQLESANLDAARYQWLRDKGRYNDFNVEQLTRGWATTHSASTLDPAIDAAMAATKGEQA